LLIIPISIYIVWKKRPEIKKIAIAPGRAGAVLVAFAILMYLFGVFGGIDTFASLSVVLTLMAIIWCLFGKEMFKTLLFPMSFLFLMIPVPSQFYAMATIPLQLLVSKSSAFIVGSLGAPILREGNVLYLPDYTLAVVQACSGLRSLMSLVTICAIFGYLTLSSNFLRVLIIASSIPVAIIVNIVRVVLMLTFLHYYNLDLAKGPLHTTFGVAIFIMALLIVTLIRGLLTRWDQKSTGE
jgi:exosortase